MRNILVLGGTLEASALARALAGREACGDRAVFSYAGRVAEPIAQPIPVRVGGFGGVPGLRQYMQDQGVTHVVDATHPFATQISGNAIAACAQAGVPLVALTRPPWQPGPGDRWQMVADLAAAAAALSGPPQRVMLAVGRTQLAAFAGQPQHHYVLRLVDAPESPPPLPHHTVIVSRGPFDVAGDTALMREHRVEVVVCKNAGGRGAEAKLHAARSLGLPVVMVMRAAVPSRHEVTSVAAVLQWMDGAQDRAAGDQEGTPSASTERGV
ncbi:cobalt-precorrin-6A reductase [soil metagenome]